MLPSNHILGMSDVSFFVVHMSQLFSQGMKEEDEI